MIWRSLTVVPEYQPWVARRSPLLPSGAVDTNHVNTEAYHLVEKFCGRGIALQCAKSMLLSMPRRSQTRFAVMPLSPPHSDAKIREAEAYLQERHTGLSPAEYRSRFAGMSVQREDRQPS